MRLKLPRTVLPDSDAPVSGSPFAMLSHVSFLPKQNRVWRQQISIDLCQWGEWWPVESSSSDTPQEHGHHMPSGTIAVSSYSYSPCSFPAPNTHLRRFYVDDARQLNCLELFDTLYEFVSEFQSTQVCQIWLWIDAGSCDQERLLVHGNPSRTNNAAINCR